MTGLLLLGGIVTLLTPPQLTMAMQDLNIEDLLPHKFVTAADLWEEVCNADTERIAELLADKADELGTMHDAFGAVRADRLGQPSKDEDEVKEKLEGDLTRSEAAQNVVSEQLQPGRTPRRELGAIDVETVRLPYRRNGIETETIDEASGPRYCAGGLYQHKTRRDLDVIRIEVVIPSGVGLGERFNCDTELEKTCYQCLPQPESDADRQEIQSRYDGRLADWQEDKIESLVIKFLQETGRLPVFSTPEQQIRDQRGRATGFSSYTLTAMNKEEVLRFTEDVGELHYLSGLMSGGGYAPGTDEPDYREMQYAALTPSEAGYLSQLLGAGDYIDREDDGDVVVDGRSMTLWPEWADEDWHMLEYQFRAVTGWDDEQDRLSLTKGMTEAYHPQVIDDAIDYYENVVEDERGQQNEFAFAYSLLKHVKRTGEPLIVLVKDDQVKVGDQTMEDMGQALVCGTFLRGHFERAQDHTGRVRSDAQYEIIGGTQLTQFLRPKGRQLAEEHLRKETELLAEKLRQVSGIAEIASQTTAAQLEEAREDGTRTYKPGADMLSDAILGGGVRMSGTSWIDAITGDGEGQIQMLNSTRGRLDFAVAAHIRQFLFRGLGMYGFGSHHGTCEDSQELLKHLWHTEAIPGYLDKSREGELFDYVSPIADPSATVLPKRVTRLMNRDDDGDITISLAAEIEVEGPSMKVIMTWGYPVVDVPVIWAVPAGTDTPFDPRNEEEEARFKRILNIFGPQFKEGEPGVEEDDITLLEAANAWRLADQGAKDQVSKEKVHGDLDMGAAMGMVRRKRDLNRAGPLTRDLERLGDLMTLSQERAVKHYKEHGQTPRIRGFRTAFEKAYDRAQKTSVKIEENLTAFKYETQPDLSAANLELPELDLTNGDYVRNDLLSMNYHQTCRNLSGILVAHGSRRSGHTLKTWDGPAGSSYHARMLRDLVQNELHQVVTAMKDIDTDPEPFRNAIEMRLRDWNDGASPDDVERVKAEAKYVQQLCRQYRSFWRELTQQEEQLMNEAADPEKMRKALDEWHAQAARQVTLSMKALSRAVSWAGLAYGIYWDWEVREGDSGETSANSPAAGVALMTGRMGQILLPPDVETEPLDDHEQHTVVWRSGNPIPIPYAGMTVEVTDIRVDREDRSIYAELETGKYADLNVDDDQPLPPPEVEAEGSPYTVRLSRTARAQGLLRWLQR